MTYNCKTFYATVKSLECSENRHMYNSNFASTMHESTTPPRGISEMVGGSRASADENGQQLVSGMESSGTAPPMT